jgi:hypothetical protein
MIVPMIHDGRVSSARSCAAESGAALRAAEPLDLLDTTVLVLRAE